MIATNTPRHVHSPATRSAAAASRSSTGRADGARYGNALGRNLPERADGDLLGKGRLYQIDDDIHLRQRGLRPMRRNCLSHSHYQQVLGWRKQDFDHWNLEAADRIDGEGGRID